MQRSSICRCALWGLLLGLADAAVSADFGEFKVKRQDVFEFTEKPKVTRDATGQSDRFVITFASRGRCDATVAIENDAGRIVRHLASGCLGPNAPAPFAKDSLKQTLVWDGKDEQGRHIDDKSRLSVRVSLGLAPRFERTLFWDPRKRVGRANRPLIVPRPEGVYVFEGEGIDQLKLFDHQGDYVRTIYPFAAGKLDQVRGLNWQEFPQDGRKLPVKGGLKHYSTLLTSGDNIPKVPGKYGCAASAMAIHDTRIALASISLNRLATDGTTGGMELAGSTTSLVGQRRGYSEKGETPILPRSAAFSPDGKRLYLAGFDWAPGYPEPHAWLNGVAWVDYVGSGELNTFAGSLREADANKPNGAFKIVTAVACDSAGRVYVADYMNDRIQVHTPDGKLFKSIAVPKPAQIAVHPTTGQIFVFSYYLANRWIANEARIPAMFYRFGPVEDPRKLAESPLPLNGYSEKTGLRWTGLHYSMTVDPYTDPPTIWQAPGSPGTTEMLEIMRGRLGGDDSARLAHIRLLVEKAGQLEVVRDFGPEVVQSVVRTMPPVISRQRLYVNPRDGMLYVAEGDSGVMKSFKQLLRIDPANGSIKRIELPITAEDMCFGLDGLIYLRTDAEVMRYEMTSWREVPWDYGEERKAVGFDGSVRTAPATSCLVLPAQGRPAWFHMSGMAISPRGRLVVSCYNLVGMPDRREFQNDGSLSQRWSTGGGRKYAPPMYPGRVRFGEVHVWDEHGKLVCEDAIPGLGAADGIAIDAHDNLYAMASACRVSDGKPYFLPWTETLFKVAAGKCRLVGSSDRAAVPLAKDDRPAESPQMTSYATGDVWIEGLQWAYGGVGFGSKTGGCVCWNARFALDGFARVFAPEIDHFSVAVLDSSGNLILRIGQYGNVDDGKPLVADGGPAKTQSVGGDETALFHAAYLAADTDRRVFIADAGNRRLLSVKLDYHATERVALKDAAASGP